MSFGAKVLSSNGIGYVDVIRPCWYVGLINNVEGNGSRTFSIPSRFRLVGVPISLIYTSGNGSWYISGNTVVWNNAKSLTVIIMAEAR